VSTVEPEGEKNGGSQAPRFWLPRDGWAWAISQLGFAALRRNFATRKLHSMRELPPARQAQNLAKPSVVAQVTSPQTEVHPVDVVPVRTILAHVAGERIARHHLAANWTWFHSHPSSGWQGQPSQLGAGLASASATYK
jgi:hypothetical protein